MSVCVCVCLCVVSVFLCVSALCLYVSVCVCELCALSASASTLPTPRPPASIGRCRSSEVSDLVRPHWYSRVLFPACQFQLAGQAFSGGHLPGPSVRLEDANVTGSRRLQSGVGRHCSFSSRGTRFTTSQFPRESSFTILLLGDCGAWTDTSTTNPLRLKPEPQEGNWQPWHKHTSRSPGVGLRAEGHTLLRPSNAHNPQLITTRHTETAGIRLGVHNGGLAERMLQAMPCLS